MHVYEMVAQQIKALGIGKVFGLMSEDTALLVATLDSLGVRFYSARHENNAIGMAEGYAAATGALGVAIIGRGPATANGLHAATYASRTGSQVLLITGDASTSPSPCGLGPDTKQLRSVEVLSAAGLTCFKPRSAGGVSTHFQEAVNHAGGGTLAVLMLPVNIQSQLVQGLPPEITLPFPRKWELKPRPSALHAAAAALKSAKRPLIIAGKGAWLSGAKESIESLSERTGALLSTTLKAKDMFAGHPYHVGMVGSFSFSVGRRFLEQADCILVLGAGLNQRTSSFGKALPQDATIIHIDHQREKIGRWHDADIMIAGDIQETVSALLQYLPQPSPGPRGFHTEEAQDFIKEFDRASEFVPANTERTMDPRQLAMLINNRLPERRRLAWDAGNFLGMLPYIDVPTPADLKNSSEFGSIGLGISTALGFATGHPDTPTYLFIGDGGLLMTLGELETMAREDIPLVVFVVNDCAYGAETHFLKQNGLPIAKSLFADIDFAAIAEPFGIQSATVRSTEDLLKVQEWIRAPDGPILIDCKVNGQVPAAFTGEHP